MKDLLIFLKYTWQESLIKHEYRLYSIQSGGGNSKTGLGRVKFIRWEENA